jgi:hypothetical protein
MNETRKERRFDEKEELWRVGKGRYCEIERRES